MEENTLTTIAQSMLNKARESSSGRSAHNLYGGREHKLQQTLIALIQGQDLKEHENPGEATIQVIIGQVELIAGDATPVYLFTGAVTLAVATAVCAGASFNHVLMYRRTAAFAHSSRSWPSVTD